MFAKQQNREPAKQYVSKTTKQCINTTAKQQNRKTLTSVSQYFSQYFSQSVLQSVSTEFSQSVLQSVSTEFSQSVFQSVSTEFSQSVFQSVLTSISQSAFLNKTLCGSSFFDRFGSRCRLRERAVRLFRLAGEQAGTGRDIRPVFESPEHYMFRDSASCVFRYAK